MAGFSARVRDPAVSMPIMDTIDWTFSSVSGARADGLLDVRKYHWYPATFIPELPYTLIEILTCEQSVVLDTFAGIGTTIFQAASLGRRTVGIEICRIAVGYARDLWLLVGADLGQGSLRHFGERLRREFVSSRQYFDDLGEAERASLETLRPWFSPETLNELAFLRSVMRLDADRVPTAAASRIALSAALKAVSAQDRGWGCVADNVQPKAEQRQKFRSALDRFVRNLGVMDRDLSRFRLELSPRARLIFAESRPEDVIRHADARTGGGIADLSVDAVITSPPYPEMTDYCMAQRLSYYFHGEAPEIDLPSEIGARRKRFRRSSLSEYGTDMAAVAHQLYRVLKPGGYVCLVMPSFSIAEGNQNSRRNVVLESFSSLEAGGFVLRGEWRRLLPTRRRHHNQKWTSLTEELILLFQKEGGVG